MNPQDMLDAHRVYDPTVTALFYQPSTPESGKDDGKQWKKKVVGWGDEIAEGVPGKEPLPYVGIDKTRSALVYKAMRSSDEEFSMRMSLLNK